MLAPVILGTLMRSQRRHSSMSDKVTRWLDKLGLGQHAEAFERNAIGLEHLPDLDHEILKEIDILAAGHRITILKAVAELTGPESSATPNDSIAAVPAKITTVDAERRQLS